MKFEGIYKAVKVLKDIDGEGFGFVDLEKLLAETKSAGEKHDLEQTARTLIQITEDASIRRLMEIPAGTPAEAIEKAKSQGTVVSEDGKYVVINDEPGKLEDGELYLHDASTFLNGKEWVKISTDTEDELNMVFALYKKI